MTTPSAHGEAMVTYRHYDTLSATVIGAIPISFAGACTVLHNVGTTSLRVIVPLAAIGLVFVLLMVYRRLDLHAATALKVAACLERGGNVDGKPLLGLASAREAIENGDFPSLKSTNGGKLYTWVMVLAVAAAALLALLAVECVRSAGQVII